jgi:hypothetical protein
MARVSPCGTTFERHAMVGGFQFSDAGKREDQGLFI